MSKINAIQRRPKTIYLDDGIHDLVEKLAAQRTLSKGEGKKTAYVDLYNSFIRKGLIEAGMIKKGDKLWMD